MLGLLASILILSASIKLYPQDKNGSIAVNDEYTVFMNSINNLINVKINDALPYGCSNPKIQIISHPINGSASVTKYNIIYTPTSDYTGQDSLCYSIQCDNALQTKLLPDIAVVHAKIQQSPTQ